MSPAVFRSTSKVHDEEVLAELFRRNTRPAVAWTQELESPAVLTLLHSRFARPLNSGCFFRIRGPTAIFGLLGER